MRAQVKTWLFPGQFCNGLYLGDVERCLVGKFEMVPKWEIQVYGLSEIFGWTPAGGSKKESWLEIFERPTAGIIRRIFCWKT